MLFRCPPIGRPLCQWWFLSLTERARRAPFGVKEYAGSGVKSSALNLQVCCPALRQSYLL